ncbi:heavy metal translocating P-type ATPase, partial [Lutispora sp.]|uniref:heavy metal translocating P-type ATPase n=1 Tax=Lutispora sp. TaxID=2828727 RepID=UPI002B1FBE4D
MIKISRGQRVLISGLLILLSFALKYLISDPVWKDALMIMAALIAGYPIALNAFRAVRFKIVGIDALVTLAVAGALIIGEYWEAAAVTFLFMFGAYLEGKTLEKTRSAIKALLDLAPNTAKVIREGTEIEIPAEEVMKGEIVIIRPGEKIPVDGTVVEGSSYVNQAAITGESIPVSRGEDETVFSGTVIESGYIKVKADRVGEDTTFSRILQMVEEAQDKKAKTQKFLEVFSKYYTPGIIVLAALVFMITRDIELALTLLVIACPGALVISTPVSIVAGIGNGAKHGVLMKGGEIIEKLGTVKVLAFDKTGTLTIGKPKVTKIKAFEGEEEELLRVTAIAEGYSEHPLARAILEEANQKLGHDLPSPEDSEIIAGHGLKAKIEERTILVGNRKLMEENSIDISDEIEDYIRGEEALGQTAVITAEPGKILGVISISDDIREGADRLIKKLKDKGIKRIVMLTGDNRRAASAIAKKLNLDDYY